MLLPKEILYIIYSYDNSSQKKFFYCIKEIENKIKIHRMISVTYNNVVLEQRKYFNYHETFYKYYFKYK